MEPLSQCALLALQQGPPDFTAVKDTAVNYLIDAPVLLAYLAGVIASIVFWKRSPRAAVLTVVATLGFLAVVILMGLQPLLFESFRSHDYDMSQIRTTMAVLAFVYRVVQCVCWALILTAIFTGRKSAS